MYSTALAKDNYLVTATPSTLLETIKKTNFNNFNIYPNVNKELFQNVVDSEMGF